MVVKKSFMPRLAEMSMADGSYVDSFIGGHGGNLAYEE